MNFESHDFMTMTAGDFYSYVKERVIPGKRMYLFFDELQRIDGWENTVNSFRVDFNCDIYITGLERLPSVLGVFDLSLRKVRGD